ncbi:putative sporulation protein YtaF [Anaerobranca californiensis DSM 14826]|jgi:putative sporulation protein YtaF|uniref:Putative sporulation protein YtaF n=1 Tax=Anaerobranca californiensis DSM 14826 TaxID=1120989 RepID=A0A1M6PQV7_9FIRM|nr:sporulation membrane protein YtaF [Anaerobranca californiensis]SHK10326.1 putative sporulation protein YtaF [Anaerobranca californiensis DSM 14826]
MEHWAVFFLALAVSLDGFGAGFAYGINRITINFWAKVLISLASAFAIYLSLLAGVLIVKILPPNLAEKLGGILLCIMGIYIIYQNIKNLVSNQQLDEEFLKKNFIHKLFILLKEPKEADFDKSGNISGVEVFFLGFALAMDAFGAGFGVALAGSNPLIMAVLVGFLKFILVSFGIILGKKLTHIPWKGVVIIIPGIIFLIIGLTNLK